MIPFEELAGSPVLSIRAGATSAVRTFRVAWDDWSEFAQTLLGRYRRMGQGYGFVPPLPFPGQPNLAVAEIEVEPFAPDGPDGVETGTLTSGTNRYPAAGARVTATYESMFADRPRLDLPPVPEGTWLSYDAHLGTEQITLPGRVWHWDAPPLNPPVAPDMQPAVQLPTGDFRLTWHRVAAPPWSAIRDLRGKVNHAFFLGAPLGTALFLGARLRREFSYAAEQGFWRVEYYFAERALDRATGGKAGWNHHFRELPIDGEQWLMIRDAGGRTPYAFGNFSMLFRFAPF